MHSKSISTNDDDDVNLNLNWNVQKTTEILLIEDLFLFV